MSKSLTTLPTTYLPTFRFPGAPKSSSKLVLFQDQLEPPQSSFHLSMEKAPTLAANRFHDDSNKEPETLEDKLMRRLSSFSTVIREAAMTKSLQNLFGATAVHGGARGGGMRSIHSLPSLQRLTIRLISAGSSSKAKTRRVFLYLGRFGLQTLPGSSYLEDTHLPKQSCPGDHEFVPPLNGVA